MFGVWLGMTLILPCLGLYWLINPRFLFSHKNLTRWHVLSFIALMVFLDVAMLVAIVQSKDGVNRYDVIGFIFILVVCFYLSAWLFYGHGQRSALLKMSKQEINPHNTESIKYNQEHKNTSGQLQISVHQEINHDESGVHYEAITQNSTDDEFNISPDSMAYDDNSEAKPSIHNDGDWQAYKQKIEQSWQETRKTLAKKTQKK